MATIKTHAVASAAAHASGKPTGAVHSGKPKVVKKVAVISMMAFAVMNITTIISLRGLPAMSEYGLTSIFYYVFAAIVFLIPTALVAAELAATYPKQGGVFRWAGEAFGPRWGFAAIYYQWQAIVIWFPTVLIFGAVSLAYVFWPESFDSALASNKIYTIAVLLGVFWFVTLFSLRGVKSSSMLSSVGGLFGTIIPGAILIILGAVYVAMGHPIQMPLNTGFIPDFSNFSNMVLAASVFLFFAGMEMQAVHVTQLDNPTRNYPLAVLVATIVVLVLFILGTLAVGTVISPKSVNLAQSLLTAYRDLWAALGVPWLGNVMAAMLAFGVMGQASVIVAGPSAGLLAVGKAGYLPHILQKTNKNGVPIAILLLQGGLVTLLCAAFTVLPSVQSAYQLLSQMATIIYLFMYLIMYVAAIRLRYAQPDIARPFKIPGGMFGMWLVGIVGLAGALTAVGFSLIPPKQIDTGSPVTYIGILVVGCVIFAALPFIFYAFHKSDWKAPDSDFEPFNGTAKTSPKSSRRAKSAAVPQAAAIANGAGK
ncbi:MAG: putative glutamine/gamma-aminobutyrate antiporter GadC [Devosia sp.]